jgi:murein DD-endopeptidase MepM/ murein hydrolase activator NlpD
MPGGGKTMKQARILMDTVKRHFKKGMQAYSAFMEKQGFYLVLGICVLVIVGTAVWTRATRTPQRPPIADSGQEAGVPYEGVQSLADVTPPAQSSLKPAPTATPAPSFLRPLPGSVARGYDAAMPVFFQPAGLWQLHVACDYQAKTGDAVKSMADGTVIGITDSGIWGKSVTIDHGDYEAVYASLSMNSYVKLGDPVRRDQTIGHVGNTALYETEQGPHLHLAIAKNGQYVDPETLFEHTDK